MDATLPIVFDLFGVLMCKQPPRYQAAMAALADVALDRFSAAYWRCRPAYDRGATARAYWSAVAEALDTVFDDAAVQRLTALDNESWSFADAEAVAVVHGLARRGVPLYLLSNIPKPQRVDLENRQSWLAECFEQRFYSCDMGVAKPSTDAFDHAFAAVRRHHPRQPIRFVDDNRDNVAAARALLVDAHRFVDIAGLKDWLEGR